MIGEVGGMNHIIGKSLGWTIPQNASFYQDWAAPRTFAVGDKLGEFSWPLLCWFISLFYFILFYFLLLFIIFVWKSWRKKKENKRIFEIQFFFSCKIQIFSVFFHFWKLFLIFCKTIFFFEKKKCFQHVFYILKINFIYTTLVFTIHQNLYNYFLKQLSENK